MRGFWFAGWLWILALGMVVLSSDHARAEGKTGEVNKKYHGLVKALGEKIESEEEFDLSKPEELHKLAEYLGNGEIMELQKEREVNILAISWDLGLWTVVVFVLLLFVLKKLAWTPWLEGIHRRESNIKEALSEAQNARNQAQLMRAELQKEMNSAAEKVRQIMDEARRDAQRAKDEMIVHARAEIQGERERLQREITMARDQALQELWSQTAQLATLISSRAIRRQLTVDDHRRLVDDAIAELRNVETNGGVRLST